MLSEKHSEVKTSPISEKNMNSKCSPQPRRGDICVETCIPQGPSPVGATSVEMLLQNTVKITKLTAMVSIAVQPNLQELVFFIKLTLYRLSCFFKEN